MTFCAWIQPVCEKALCERAVKCPMGGLCSLARELHLSPGPCPWSLPNWLCRYACAQPGTVPILPLPCWLDFPVWPGISLIAIDLSSDHRTVGWTWLPSSDLLCSSSGTVGLHLHQSGHCPTCVVAQLLACLPLQSSPPLLLHDSGL